jgi:hypothetical protein
MVVVVVVVACAWWAVTILKIPLALVHHHTQHHQ